MNNIDNVIENLKIIQQQFPNGFSSWYETFYEIVDKIVWIDSGLLPTCKKLQTISNQGRSCLYELAKELTDKFENNFIGVKWGSNEYLCYFDRLEEFLNKELYI